MNYIYVKNSGLPIKDNYKATNEYSGIKTAEMTKRI